MLYCPNCGTKNKSTYNYCYRCGKKVKLSISDSKPKKKIAYEFKVNDYITLKLEYGKTVIYVNNEKFLQCNYLLLEIPKNELQDFQDISSIDEVSEKLDHSLESSKNSNQITPELEFWGHCSNLQAWWENSYDTSLLHSNLSFPLLKKLTDFGDPIAKRVFKDEIAKRLTSGYDNIRKYLVQENYLEYFNEEEMEVLNANIFKQIEDQFYVKHRNHLNAIELETLLDIINVNISCSKIFLINQMRPVEIVNDETQMGFSYEKALVTALNLNRCRLQKLPPSIKNIQNLKKLYLAENRLKLLAEAIGNLKNLEKLNLSDNILTELPIEIGNLTNLKELNLNHNNLYLLPDSISKLENLEILLLWGNQLRILPSNTSRMASLKVLGLSYNRLEKFSDLPLKLQNLEILDLSNNHLKFLNGNLEQLISLKSLWLNNNPIKELPINLKDLKALKDLYIINTPIALKPDIESKKLLDDLERKDVNIWK